MGDSSTRQSASFKTKCSFNEVPELWNTTRHYCYAGGGIAFFISANNETLGSAGGLLGFFGLNGTNSLKSVVVELDNYFNEMAPEYDIGWNHVSLDFTNITYVAAKNASDVNVNLWQPSTVYAWVEYSATTKQFEVDEDMIRHNELLGEIEKNELALDAIVAKRRKDFTGDFFDHLHTLCDANYKNLDRRDEITALAKKCLSTIEAHDVSQEDSESLGEAQLKFDDILNSPSLEAAVNKIDKLAQRQELDSTLMLLMTKAWAAAKESTMMKDEVKDILFHLYNVARGNMQRLVPKEVRIIRYLLSIQDPREQRAALTEAFSPGSELEGNNEDLLYTTPEKLLQWIKVVLDAYRTNKQTTLVKEAQKLMNPEVISRVEVLKKVVEDQFM